MIRSITPANSESEIDTQTNITLKGTPISIVKVSNKGTVVRKKKNCNGKTVRRKIIKVDQIRKGILAKTIATGHPVCFQNEQRINSMYAATSRVLSMEEKDDGSIKLETENSFYIITLNK